MIGITVLSLVGLVIGFVVLRIGFERQFAAERARSRSPFKEKLLRPAGESLRVRIEAIQDEMMSMAFPFAGGLILPVVTPLIAQGRSWEVQVAIWCLMAAVGYGFALCQWTKLKNLREELRNHRLGFDGERYVAEKLSALTAEGYLVFHDFVFDMLPSGKNKAFNIDHIVVGTRGVFAIETKAYRQRHGDDCPGEEAHKLKASEDLLLLPRGRTLTKPAAQAKRNAAALSKWLTGSSSQSVSVLPVLVMVGWFVEDDKTGTVPVLSGRPVAKMLRFLGSEGALSPERVAAISDRIEAHCRNIESV